ncbi:hypothetical protein J7E25_06950 [Agromyces sp. ISL-38]|uniref:hypothetical protein n=1 Tax=Agromyces sp. ISL-38 TaxID=2819107 RepID=UPI001BEC4652|nr:hypothetical protein [Agromyces sp. ISL-38]MBT2498829.1 hypothetical protein [Agromyces sp. ISL-38]MBT2516486.1 hypothetical protein [Streptomyces sp. ISL-90]
MITRLAGAILIAADEEFDPDTVTPGIWGFVVTFGLMVVVVLLILDMVRRIRRTNYRAEVRERLEIERLEAEMLGDEGSAPDASSPSPNADDEENDTGATSAR